MFKKLYCLRKRYFCIKDKVWYDEEIIFDNEFDLESYCKSKYKNIFFEIFGDYDIKKSPDKTWVDFGQSHEIEIGNFLTLETFTERQTKLNIADTYDNKQFRFGSISTGQISSS